MAREFANEGGIIGSNSHFGRISKTDPVIWLSVHNKNELRKVESEIGSQYDKYSSEDLFKKAV